MIFFIVYAHVVVPFNSYSRSQLLIDTERNKTVEVDLPSEWMNRKEWNAGEFVQADNNYLWCLNAYTLYKERFLCVNSSRIASDDADDGDEWRRNVQLALLVTIKYSVRGRTITLMVHYVQLHAFHTVREIWILIFVHVLLW